MGWTVRSRSRGCEKWGENWRGLSGQGGFAVGEPGCRWEQSRWRVERGFLKGHSREKGGGLSPLRGGQPVLQHNGLKKRRGKYRGGGAQLVVG